ncbi:MAG: prolipoprotein diacylglyceryl transferase [Phycisphaerae bacterium]|nr:prolipoprotein diacylglyceryl transferase [Phycisphaerae bacterium]
MLLAESYLHTLDPYVIQFGDGGFGIRWYGLSYVVGFIIAWALIKWLARTGRSLVSAPSVGDLMIYAVLGVLIGGRLGYAIFYDPALFIEAARNQAGEVVIPWWALLAINQGGMASHGGMIGAVLAVLIFMKRNGYHPIFHGADLLAFVAPPGLFLGRLANFINGELWGHPVSDQTTPPWWSVKYPEEVLQGSIDVDRLRSVIPGDQSFLPNVVQSLRSGQTVVVEEVVPKLTAYYPSQLFQALAEGPVLFLILIAVWWVPRKTGVIMGSFLCSYGVLRIVTELFRQPDEGIALTLGLSRGQLLSVFMILIGLVIILLGAMSKGPRIGGLGRPVVDHSATSA